MSGASKTVDRIKDRHFSKSAGKKRLNPLYGDFDETSPAHNPIAGTKQSAGDVTALFTPDIPEPEEQPVIPIPDESLQANEARRRRAQRASTGRQSTRLTEGLGG